MTLHEHLGHPRLAGATVVALRTVAEHAAFVARDEPADVVVVADVLGALRDPLVGLRAVHARCAVATVIEASAIAVGGHPEARLWRFDGQRWTPTRPGLEGLSAAAGFARVEVLGGDEPAVADGQIASWRAVLRAWR